MTHDVCGPPTIAIWKKEFGEKAKIWDKQKLVIFPDHYIFTKNPHANRNVDILRSLQHEYDLPNYYDVGTERYKGVCHIAWLKKDIIFRVQFYSGLIHILVLPEHSECLQPESAIQMQLSFLVQEKSGKKFPNQ